MNATTLRRYPNLTLAALLVTAVFCQAQVTTIPVWEKAIPGAIANPAFKPETTYIDGGKPRISKVSNPTLAYYPVAPDKATGVAIVICPGGGYGRLAIDHEGWDVAEWLKGQGIAAFILTYRLPSDEIMKNKCVGPLQDVQEAIRIVRRHAKEWHIDTHKIGVMGFSAGGHLAASISTMYGDKVYDPADTTSARPDFSVLVYPVISMEAAITHQGSRENLLGSSPSEELVKHFSADERVTADTPPAFLVHAADDKTVPLENSLNYLQAMRKAGVPCELHVYESGGHGFGLGGGVGTKSNWPEAFMAWLRARKIL